MPFFSSPRSPHLIEKSGVLHIYYANKPFKHWKKRWLHLQDQQLAIYQGKFSIVHRRFIFISLLQIRVTNGWKRGFRSIVIVSQLQIRLTQYLKKDIISK